MSRSMIATDGPLFRSGRGRKTGWRCRARSLTAPNMRASGAIKKRFGAIEKTVGVLLVGTGILFLTGGFQSMSLWLIETFAGLRNYRAGSARRSRPWADRLSSAPQSAPRARPPEG